MSTEECESQERIEWEPIARHQLGRGMMHAYWKLEEQHRTLKSKIEDGEEITTDDLNDLRGALNVYQTYIEKDVTELTDSEPFGGHAVDNIPPSAVTDR